MSLYPNPEIECIDQCGYCGRGNQKVCWMCLQSMLEDSEEKAEKLEKRVKVLELRLGIE